MTDYLLPELWCYVCGRINARETQMLLPPSFFDSLLAVNSLEDAHQLISQTGLRDVFQSPEELLHYDEKLDEMLIKEALDIAGAAPTASIAAFFLWPNAFLQLRRQLTELAKKVASRDEILSPLKEAYRSDPALAGLGEIMAEKEFLEIQYDETAESQARVADLLASLDGLLLKALSLVARRFSTAATEINDFLQDFISAKVAETVARGLASGRAADRLIPFLTEGPVADVLGERIFLRPGAPQEAIEAFSPPSVLAQMRQELMEGASLNPERFVLWMESALFERLASVRAIPFGAERAFQYLAAFRAQTRNIKLALSAIVHDLDRQEARQRLRRLSFA